MWRGAAESQFVRNFLYIPQSTVATSLRQVYVLVKYSYLSSLYSMLCMGTLHDLFVPWELHLLNICALGSVLFSKTSVP